jgi:predicted pyridoxine 5'-phosphate oxidase superfamily flavin-nucleotide-binding protein
MSKKISFTLTEMLRNAEAKALAKSAKNIEASPQVALTAWTGMKGVQIKGTAEYLTYGPDFEEAVSFAASENPSRVVKGLIILSPTKIFDISPGGAFSATDLAL